ncbi:MAG: O-fucosyltransferase family protein [Acidiphilium sp.]
MMSNEKLLPVSKEEIKITVKKLFGYNIYWKPDLMSPLDMANLTDIELAILDFELTISAPTFIGTSYSTFSNLCAFEKYSRTRVNTENHFLYNTLDDHVVARRDNGAFSDAELATAVR